jgi:regulator of replication initiation timing
MMRDRKISILLIVSFLLLLASFLILCTWVYNYYTRDRILVKTETKSAPARTEFTRDSLLKIYTTAIRGMEQQLGNTYTRSDSMETALRVRLDEYYRLRDELAVLLKTPASSDDFKLASKKITELQDRIKELTNTSAEIQQENSKLYKLLAQLNKERKPVAQSVPHTDNGTVASSIENEVSRILFSTAEMSLAAVKDDEAGEQDMFSNQRKIIGSFALTNTVDMHNAEVMIVIIQPNGQVLQKSAWESGAFQTTDGKKIYSLKLLVDYTRGEAKKLTFSISTDKFLPGTYNMQLYNKGSMIGKLTRTLS